MGIINPNGEEPGDKEDSDIRPVERLYYDGRVGKVTDSSVAIEGHLWPISDIQGAEFRGKNLTGMIFAFILTVALTLALFLSVRVIGWYSILAVLPIIFFLMPLLDFRKYDKYVTVYFRDGTNFKIVNDSEAYGGELVFFFEGLRESLSSSP